MQGEGLSPIYEELAEAFGRKRQPRQRDHCFVLAADAALRAGRPGEAERLRQRLLGCNPHHLLRPYASMAEAALAKDIKVYVDDLRRQWPPEQAQRTHQAMLAEPPTPDEAGIEPTPPAPFPDFETRESTLAEEPAPRRPAAPTPPRRPLSARIVPPPASPSPYETPSAPLPAAPANAVPPLAVWAASMLFLLGVLFALVLFFLAFVWPLLD